MTIQVRSDAGGAYGAIQVNGTDRLVVDNNGNVSCTGMPVNQGPFTFRNRLLNPAMVIGQRGSTATIALNSFAYTLDRHIVSNSGAAVTTSQTGSLGALYLTITGAAGNTSAAWSQRVESYNIADLAGQTVTLSATMYSSIPLVVTAQYYIPTAQDNYTSQTSANVGAVLITSTPTRYYFTFTLPSGATNGAQVTLNGASLTSGTFNLTNVQLEAGSVATAFEVRPYNIELMMCQRYFYQINTTSGSSAPRLSVDGVMFGGSNGGNFACRHPVPMRTSPSTALFNSTFSTINSGVTSYTVTTAAVDSGSPFVNTFSASATSTGTGGLKAHLYRTPASGTYPYLQFSAEI